MGLKDWLFGSPPPPTPPQGIVSTCRICSTSFPSYFRTCPNVAHDCARRFAELRADAERSLQALEQRRRTQYVCEADYVASKQRAEQHFQPMLTFFGPSSFPSGQADRVASFLKHLPGLIETARRSGQISQVYVELVQELARIGPYWDKATLEQFRVQVLRAAGVPADFPLHSPFFTTNVDAKDRTRGEFLHAWLVAICYCLAGYPTLPAPYHYMSTFYKQLGNDERPWIERAAAEVAAREAQIAAAQRAAAAAPPTPPPPPPPPPPARTVMDDAAELLTNPHLDAEEKVRELLRRMGKAAPPPPTTIDPP